MTMFSTPTLCNYPDCKAVAKKTWAELPLCPGHHETIRLETLKYYDARFTYEHRQHYLQIARLIEGITPLYAQKAKKLVNRVKKRNDLAMNRPIEDLDFTIKTYATLKRNGINFEKDLQRMTYEEITVLRNIGRKSIEEIEEKLGIEFKPSKGGGGH